MVLLSVLTKRANPRIGYAYKVGKLSYKTIRCTSWLGKVETLASYVLGLVSSRLAWTWITVKWVWSNRRKSHWSKATETYLLSLVPPGVPLSVDVVHKAACFDGDAVDTKEYWYKKAALVYLSECFQRHTCAQQQDRTTYLSPRLLTEDPHLFPIRTCLQGFFSSHRMGDLVALARSRPGQLQLQEFWQQDVPAVTTTILQDVDTRLAKDLAELCLL